jgi:DNA adenine methylase
MKKLFKWPGGKTKELKIISSLLPDHFDRIIEPFAGSGALTFHLEKNSLLNDTDKNIINFYRVIKDDVKFKLLFDKCQDAQSIPFQDANGNTLEKLYYDCRQRLNQKDFSDDVQMAHDFLITRQLSFSGMIRLNPKGEFNVPYGWYQKLTFAISNKHHEFIKNSVDIVEGDFEKVINATVTNDFLFLDPPYRQKAGYAVSHFTDDDHCRLATALSQTSTPWLLVHCDDELYRDLYKNFNITTQNFQYNINFKGRKMEDLKVNHLYISNY